MSPALLSPGSLLLAVSAPPHLMHPLHAAGVCRTCPPCLVPACAQRAPRAWCQRVPHVHPRRGASMCPTGPPAWCHRPPYVHPRRGATVCPTCTLHLPAPTCMVTTCVHWAPNALCQRVPYVPPFAHRAPAFGIVCLRPFWSLYSYLSHCVPASF